MIRILKSWLEIGECYNFLCRKGLPHSNIPAKNWEFYYAYTLAEHIGKTARIIDLGCGEPYMLKLLHQANFVSLFGVDLSISFSARLSQIHRMWRGRTLKPPFRLYKGDICRTRFQAGAFDLALCLSVLEHGVNIERFFAEAFRILRADGRLFITVDYWKEHIDIPKACSPFGLTWHIFSDEDIRELLRIARAQGFSLLINEEIPIPTNKVIVWNSQEYTLLSVIFVKANKP